MGHPDFRVNGKIFASLHGDLQNGMVKLTPDQQQTFVSDHTEAFMPENGAWGRQGCTRVRLSAADEDAVGEAMTLAWQNVRQTPTTRRAQPGARRRSSRVRLRKPRE